MLVVVPEALDGTDFGQDKDALKIVSRIVCGSIEQCAEYRSEHHLKGKPDDPFSVFGRYVNIHSDELKALVSRYRTVCERLEHANLIQRNVSHSNFTDRRKYPKSFRLHPSLWSNPLILRCVRQRLNKRKFKCVVGDDKREYRDAYQKAEQSLHHFRLDESRVEQIDSACDASTWSDLSRYRAAALEKIAWWSVVDDYGRYHTPLTQLPKQVRAFILCDGHTMTGFDLANIQPALLTLQQVVEVPEYEKKYYCTLCSTGQLYEELMRLCPRYETRDEIKEAFNRMLNQRNADMIPSELYQRFALSFPKYADCIRRIKQESHKDMARFLQRNEARVMFGGVVREFMRRTPAPWFTVHDSMFVERSRAGILRGSFLKMIYESNLPTTIREEGRRPTTRQHHLLSNVTMKETWYGTIYNCAETTLYYVCDIKNSVVGRFVSLESESVYCLLWDGYEHQQEAML